MTTSVNKLLRLDRQFDFWGRNVEVAIDNLRYARARLANAESDLADACANADVETLKKVAAIKATIQQAIEEGKE